MIEIELPTMPENAWLGVTIERGTIATTAAFAVTVIDGVGRSSRRCWFQDYIPTHLDAAGLAEDLGLPLFDRTGE